MTRRFGVFDGAALVIASVVGAGIFTVPAYVATLGGSRAVILGLWVGGGLMALAGALSYAELASRLPRGGAEYVYLREAFGPTAGFLSGWTSFIAGFSGAIAAAAVGFAHYLPQVLPAADRLPTTGVAVALIAFFTFVTVMGVRASRWATNALTLLIIGGIIMIAVSGFGGTVSSPTSVPVNAGALSALVPIFFTYSGWNAAAYVASEFRDPARTIPRALITGTVAVTLLYVALNAGMLRAVSVTEIAGSAAPVSLTAATVLGTRGSTIVGALVLVALASSVCALIITGSRIYKEMAADGALPAVFGRSRGSSGAPAVAAVAQSAWSSVLVLTGTFEQIVTYTGFAIMLFSGAAVTALFVLRRRHGTPRTYRVPWYPVVPAAFVLTAAAIAVASFRYAPGPSIAGVALIAVGYICAPQTRMRREVNAVCRVLTADRAYPFTRVRHRSQTRHPARHI